MNRAVQQHRIANSPNYVTFTSSLTHHRIVNLGPHGASAPPVRTKAKVTHQLAHDPPSYSPLWCHNDVIITSALGYEVLRKRKYDHMTHHTTLT